MDALGFIASIISSLAWPLTLIVLAFVLREQLRDLFARLTTLKFKDIEIDFGKALERLEAQVSIETAEKAEELPLTAPAQISEDEFERLVDLSPSAAVLHAWIGVEKMLRQMAAHHGVENSSKGSIPNLTRMLLTGRQIDMRTAVILDNLRTLRNFAVHPSDREITRDDAIRFKALSDEVIRLLAGSAD